MQKFKNTIKKLLSDESGQGATEYILLLVVVVALAMIFRPRIEGFINAKLDDIGNALGAFTTGNGP